MAIIFPWNRWAEVERESGLKLVHMTGGLDLTRRGKARDNVLEKYAQAMAAQNIPYVFQIRIKTKSENNFIFVLFPVLSTI